MLHPIGLLHILANRGLVLSLLSTRMQLQMLSRTLLWWQELLKLAHPQVWITITQLDYCKSILNPLAEDRTNLSILKDHRLLDSYSFANSRKSRLQALEVRRRKPNPLLPIICSRCWMSSTDASLKNFLQQRSMFPMTMLSTMTSWNHHLRECRLQTALVSLHPSVELAFLLQVSVAQVTHQELDQRLHLQDLSVQERMTSRSSDHY